MWVRLLQGSQHVGAGNYRGDTDLNKFYKPKPKALLQRNATKHLTWQPSYFYRGTELPDCCIPGSIERSHGKLLRPVAVIRTVWLSHRLTLCLRVCACTHAVLWTKRCGICFQPSVWGAKRGKGTRRQPGCSPPTQQLHQCHTCPLWEAALGPDILCSIQPGHNGNCVWNQPQNTDCFTCFEGDAPSSWHFLKKKIVKEKWRHIFNKIKANCAPNVYTWSRQIWGVVQQSSVNLTLSFAPCWLIVR